MNRPTEKKEFEIYGVGMSETKMVNTGGIGFSGLLTIVFITLKLTGYIDWSWWWVLSPLWIPFAVGMTIIVLLAIFTNGKFYVRRRK